MYKHEFGTAKVIIKTEIYKKIVYFVKKIAKTFCGFRKK